jgi:hypothetical protein
MREMEVYLKHHYQHLREKKCNNLKLSSGGLQGSTRSQMSQQNHHQREDPMSWKCGMIRKPNWRTNHQGMD